MINSFNHFRALAIFMIVAGHSMTLGSIKINSFEEGVIANIIIGGTALFVFISGFLFREIFYEKYNFKKFMLGKTSNVIIPYTIMSITAIIYILFIQEKTPEYLIKFTSENNTVNIIISTLNFIITGQFLVAYWYIPFIVLMFLFSPLHVLYIKQSTSIKIYIFVFLYLIAIFIHRPENNINPFHSLLYYTPVYLFGILCSEQKNNIYKHIDGKLLIIAVAVIGISAFQTYIGKIGNYHSSLKFNSEIDLMIIQKTLMCILLMVFLNKFENKKYNLVDITAKTSFAIFFFHPYLITVALKYEFYPRDESWPIYYLSLILIMLTSILIALTAKRVFNRKSRLITGY